MAEIAAGFVGPAIEVVKWIGAPIIRQFNYLCCFTTNINSLKHESQKLDEATTLVQEQVDRARDNLQVIVPQVETWLTTSVGLKHQTNGILYEATNAESGCLKLRTRFSLSKRAKTTSEYMKDLRGQCKFDAISQPGPPPATEAVPLGMAYEFESRKQIEQDIMTTLRCGDVNTIGICGMGGLGKTTMAKRIMNRALEEHVFDEVVMAVFSQQVDKSSIQVEIGGSLGLKKLGEESSQVRVKRLHARLTVGTKRILLVLDDVWERFVLEDLGIPCGSKGCTILLTSRNRDVLSAMNVGKIFGMEVLSEEDAWFLFKERVGVCVDDTKLNSIAKKVVDECRGLPIALTTVGSALKDEKNESIWKDALRQLRQSDPDIPEFIANVYNPLKLSYDALGSKHAKSVFLLCCLFREDADIRLEYLTYFCVGLNIFEGGITNLEEARNKMCALTKMLRSRSLLLETKYEDRVRMHDVVRDVCIFIAKQEGYIGGNACTWISSFQLVGERTDQLRTRLVFPNLRLLFLIRSSVEEELEFNNTFFEGIRDLYVLSIQNYSLTSLPHTTHSLKNLSTLILYSCPQLETISIVGELVHLEILICYNCGLIEELPPTMMGLSRLKMLDLSWCRNLQRVAPGIISSLVGLEELKMLESFKKWEADERKSGNAGVRELEALTNLRWLEIMIEDPALAAENIHLSSKLERFEICIPFRAISRLPPPFFFTSPRTLSLEWEGETCLGHWIEMQLLRDTEYLHISGNGAKDMDLAKNRNIRWLMLGKCETMKNIVTSSMDVFPHIEHLGLFSLPKLQGIWDTGSLQNLKESSLTFTNLSSIYINRCPRLRNLGQLSTAGKDCLSQLETLIIQECEIMEQVFLWNKEDGENITKMFPKLKMVTLSTLPNLATLYQGIGGIEFPLLSRMTIEDCPKMTSIVDDNSSSHLICQPKKMSFGSLKYLLIQAGENLLRHHKIPVSSFKELEELKISRYHGSMGLFRPSIARNFVNLRKLNIWECYEMVKVIEDEGEEEEREVNGGERILLFPKLQELHLLFLGKLVMFCEWQCDIELPSLREMVVRWCPSMKSFTLGHIIAPNLKVVKINREDFGAAKDLNAALQQHFARAKEQKGKGGKRRW